MAAFGAAVVVLIGIWAAAGPNSAADIRGDAEFYLDLWEQPQTATAPPFTYRVLTPWLARLVPLDAFWGFAVVTIAGLAVAGVLLWMVVMWERPPQQAWLALGLWVLSPAAVFSLADHYLVDAAAYAFLAGVLVLLQRRLLTLAALVCVVGLLAKESVLFAAPVVLLYAVQARARLAAAVLLVGAPALYVVLHRTSLIINSAEHEFPYFTGDNLSWVLSSQGGVLQAAGVALVVGCGPLAVAAALAWRGADELLRRWALLLVPFLLSVLIAGDWTRMLAYTAVVLVPIAAQRSWSLAGAALVLAVTAVSAVGVQRLTSGWLQLLAGVAVIALYGILAGRRPFSPEPMVG